MSFRFHRKLAGMSLLRSLKPYLPRIVRERVLPPIARFVYRKNLSRLASHFGTDKVRWHWYTQHYQRYFASLRTTPVKLLEIGVGGYADSAKGGESLRMWKSYFLKGQIVGIDIADKTHFSQSRIDIRMGDQTDEAFLRGLSSEYAGFDLIIDDGSHMNEHVIETFGILFPLLKTPGFYAVEDVQTSYWPSCGGGVDNPKSIMAFFKNLADGVNHPEYPIPGYVPTYFDTHITEIAFFHNLILIRKEDYTERSNVPERVEEEIQALSQGLGVRSGVKL